MRFLRVTALAALLLASVPFGARAGLIDFTFTFINQTNGFGGGGTVTGIVRGLSDNATSAASSLEILSNSSGFGVGEYIGSPSLNDWTLVGGAVTGFDFLTFGVDNTAPTVTCCSLAMADAGLLAGTFLSDLDFLAGGILGAPMITFTPVAVPEPSTALILGTVLLLGGVALRRRGATA